MIDLKHLDISINKITDITHLKNLINLQNLYLHNNNISSIDILLKFDSLNFLTILDLNLSIEYDSKNKFVKGSEDIIKLKKMIISNRRKRIISEFIK